MGVGEWLDFWPGNEHHASELISMRRGLLSGFVELLVEQARPDSYIDNARASFELNILQEANPDLNNDADDPDCAEAEAIIRSLEKKEKELFGRITGKYLSHQPKEFEASVKQVYTKLFLERVKRSSSLEACISNTSSLQKRLIGFPGVFEKSIKVGQTQNYTQILNINKNLFTDIIREAANREMLVNSALFSQRKSVCKALKLCTQSDVSKFWSWWADDLNIDLDNVDKTSTENSELDDAVACLNQLFSDLISRWTDIHVRIGMKNMESDARVQEVHKQLIPIPGCYVGSLSFDLALVDYMTSKVRFIRRTDVQDYVAELETVSMDTPTPTYNNSTSTTLPMDYDAKREVDVEFLCVLLKTWPEITFKLEEAIGNGNLTSAKLVSSGSNVRKVVRSTLDWLHYEELNTYQRNSSAQTKRHSSTASRRRSCIPEAEEDR